MSLGVLRCASKDTTKMCTLIVSYVMISTSVPNVLEPTVVMIILLLKELRVSLQLLILSLILVTWLQQNRLLEGTLKVLLYPMQIRYPKLPDIRHYKKSKLIITTSLGSTRCSTSKYHL